jgi:hypothetical protein
LVKVIKKEGGPANDKEDDPIQTEKSKDLETFFHM